jgi:hypothetical protein
VRVQVDDDASPGVLCVSVRVAVFVGGAWGAGECGVGGDEAEESVHFGLAFRSGRGGGIEARAKQGVDYLSSSCVGPALTSHAA